MATIASLVVRVMRSRRGAVRVTHANAGKIIAGWATEPKTKVRLGRSRSGNFVMTFRNPKDGSKMFELVSMIRDGKDVWELRNLM